MSIQDKNLQFIAEVQCDKCHWSLKDQNIYSWHDVLCPECENAIIITDADLKIAENVTILEGFGVLERVNESTGGKFAKGDIIWHLDSSDFEFPASDNNATINKDNQ